MNYKINWQVSVSNQNIPDKKAVRLWVDTTLRHRDVLKAELSLSVVSLAEIQELNKTYRQQDKPTNVLSFPSEVPDFITLATPELGDILLCADIIEQEALDQHKTLESHYAHMVIHGVLHLLGYDHIEPNDAEEMESIEIDLLHSLGYPNPYIASQKVLHD